jgi:LuxR family maltose regulon positive regulatory protein
MPLDDEGIWYRYHHLFAEVLQARLEQTNRDLVSNLHHRAGDWYEKQGMMEEAVRHTLASTDFEQAARLIEAVAGDVLRRGSSASVMRWFESMPEDLIRARPHLCLARGWTFFLGAGLNIESADELAQLASQSATEDELLRGEAAALQAMIAVTRGELARCRELSQQALDALPLDSPWRNAVTFGLGTAHLDSGNMALAADALGEAMQLSEANGDYYIQFAAASFLGDIQVFQGHLSRAMEIYQQVLAWADPNIPQKGEVMAHGGLAQILCERDQLDAAFAQIQLGTDQIDRVGGAWSAFVIYRVLARVRLAQGRWNSALDFLSRARQLGEESQVRLVVTMAAALSASLQLAQDDLEAATAWAENSGLSPDDGEVDHPGWREVEYLTLARVLDAQGRQAEAMSLLDRLLQSAQVEGRDGSAVGILILRALFEQAQDNKARAFERLEYALTLAEPEVYVRIFVDEGEPMRLLLRDYQAFFKKKMSDGVDSNSLRLLSYTDKLLAAFSQPPPEVIKEQDTLPEPLSERELDILRLIATGRTNQEIAEILVIALSTVKSHINNLYGKLGTNRRTEAIAIERELGLTSE